MAINILDSVIANRISAGEVVEKPASIVKELLDNSVDAGANDITIEILNGGIDMIAIRDNGCGIAPDDIKKAFLPHATSKISSLDDLDNITTLGFRGEALASIASVCQVTMISKTKELDYANKLSVNGGEFGEVSATSGPNGTYIEVRNLFYNTPARRKFLRRPKTEENEITNYISRYILAHPYIKIKYVANNSIIFDHKGNNLLDAISCVYGNDTTQNILPIEYDTGAININGYIGKISFTKPNTTYQTLLINGRYVIDESLSKAVYSAYEEFLMSRQFPFFVINLTMPYDQVDVNVHPNKMNVKFAHQSMLYDLFYRAARQAIYNSINPVKENYGYNIQQPAVNSAINTTNFQSSVNIEKSNAEHEVNDIKDVNAEQKVVPAQEDEIDIAPIAPVNYDNLFGDTIRLEKFVPERNASIFDKDVELSATEEHPSYQPINDFTSYKVIGEVFNEFLILEKDDTLLIIDFHAGHERLLYDKLVDRINNSAMDIQTLLVPYFHNLNVLEAEYILNMADRLKKFGFEVEQFGANEIKISTVPVLLSDINLKQFVEDLLHDMKNQKPKINDNLDHMLMQKACKSAVKAGMALSDMQIKQLLKNLDINKPVLLCPHGRPIVTVIKRSQFEKWFKRIV